MTLRPTKLSKSCPSSIETENERDETDHPHIVKDIQLTFVNNQSVDLLPPVDYLSTKSPQVRKALPNKTFRGLFAQADSCP